MDFRQLRYFVAVAEAGHMTRAAAQLGIQQPPLSQQIKALEAQLGLVLLQRHPKGVALTDAGRQLLAGARPLLNDLAALQGRMKRLAGGQHGELAIGFTSSAAAHAYTPMLLRECRSRHPGIALTLSEDHAAALIEQVARQRLHAALLRVPVARPEGVVFETLLSEPAWLALPLDHRLARVPRAARTPVALAELAGEALILVRRPGAPGLYGKLLALCEQAGVPVRVAAEVERMMTNLNLVAAGAGISVVPGSMRGSHAASVVYRPLPTTLDLDAPLTLAWRSADLTGPVPTFVALARQLATGHAAA
ncbi:LysR family transcriptional regulator [Pseudorhodoferax sp.]|uniref:LysR family transcriptional regulator n=1 Tax=Pseudorhodoferax sp. TaxID=1993553 RepID=UPI002DD640D8|nr:LysR family transcriptional regulator [Pseudorhodoferax sp.]